METFQIHHFIFCCCKFQDIPHIFDLFSLSFASDLHKLLQTKSIEAVFRFLRFLLHTFCPHYHIFLHILLLSSNWFVIDIHYQELS